MSTSWFFYDMQYCHTTDDNGMINGTKNCYEPRLVIPASRAATAPRPAGGNRVRRLLE